MKNVNSNSRDNKHICQNGRKRAKKWYFEKKKLVIFSNSLSFFFSLSETGNSIYLRLYRP